MNYFRLLHLTFAILLLMSATGCQLLGVAAHALPPPTIQPQYELTGETVGVYVWADRGVKIDFTAIDLDLANAIQQKLAAPTKEKVMKGTTFPVKPASILRWWKDHPESEGSPITMIAPKLTVKRLIYVELERFVTRSDLSVDLFRGAAEATVRVIEVNEDGTARVAHEQNGVKAVFPKKAPVEGVPNIGDDRIYTGMIDTLSTEVANLFLPHPAEED
jgi:hypothetical protein